MKIFRALNYQSLRKMLIVDGPRCVVACNRRACGSKSSCQYSDGLIFCQDSVCLGVALVVYLLVGKTEHGSRFTDLGAVSMLTWHLSEKSDKLILQNNPVFWEEFRKYASPTTLLLQGDSGSPIFIPKSKDNPKTLVGMVVGAETCEVAKAVPAFVDIADPAINQFLRESGLEFWVFIDCDYANVDQSNWR